MTTYFDLKLALWMQQLVWKITNGLSLQYQSITSSCKLKPSLTSWWRVLGVHDVMTLNPHAFRNLLTAPDVQLDADYILNLFSTQFSEPGCNRREIEEQAIIYWVNFIQLIECKHKIYPLQCFSPPIIKHNIMCENAFWGGVRIPIQLPPTKLILH